MIRLFSLIYTQTIYWTNYISFFAQVHHRRMMRLKSKSGQMTLSERRRKRRHKILTFLNFLPDGVMVLILFCEVLSV